MISYFFSFFVFLGVIPFALGFLSYVLFSSEEQDSDNNSTNNSLELTKSTTS